MSIDTTVQSTPESDPHPPSAAVASWIDAAANEIGVTEGELTVRFVGVEEMQSLNRTWRQKDVPTNVLSFEFDGPAELPVSILGDIVVCARVVTDEAERFAVTTDSRFAHMTVHGFLHLNGFDHTETEDASRMEAAESTIMNAIGFDDPWMSEVPVT